MDNAQKLHCVPANAFECSSWKMCTLEAILCAYGSSKQVGSYQFPC